MMMSCKKMKEHRTWKSPSQLAELSYRPRTPLLSVRAGKAIYSSRSPSLSRVKWMPRVLALSRSLGINLSLSSNSNSSLNSSKTRPFLSQSYLLKPERRQNRWSRSSTSLSCTSQHSPRQPVPSQSSRARRPSLRK